MTERIDRAIRNAYIDLIKRSITNFHYLGGTSSFEEFRSVTHYDLENSRWKIDRLACPLTLLTKGQLDLLESVVATLESQKVPGDFIEAGVWRGGVIVLLRALLGAYGISDRKVFAADSFEGIPLNSSDRTDPVNAWSDRWVAKLDEVQQNIRRFGILDERIRFVVGYFSDSLRNLSQERFALIRLDSDSYDSVLTSLEYLYPRLSKGGFLIVDDWHLQGCRDAVKDYLTKHAIAEDVHVRDNNAFWIKQKEFGEC